MSWLQAVDVGLVVACAKEAPDAALLNAALSLLDTLARRQPDTTLTHVLEVGPAQLNCPGAGLHYCVSCRQVLLVQRKR